MLVIVLKKILKLSDNMYSNKLSSVFYEFIFFNNLYLLITTWTETDKFL